ncbi:hypothetical protein QTH97_02270 [Variovorax sp. J22R24]|uniref:hypothetical protein n=1 Tax=Variovorax gracilis TaxID=3053502 RepID=UPI002577693E|nr:hypothetical protein [Variovorax sp. J22R24]MDM0103742.1 hypothetical protein [Variovorax sp. J22R24]
MSSTPIPIPYADIPFNKLTMEQRREREKAMAAEGDRLADEMGRVQRPAQPVWINQIYDPRQRSTGPTPEQAWGMGAAAELIERLAQKDRGNAS